MRANSPLFVLSLFYALSSVAAAQGSDDCSNAQPISGLGLFALDNTGATTDGPAGCGGFSRDVWYSWIAPSSGSYEVSTCGTAGWDTTLAIYVGTCGSLIAVGCNDDACSFESTVNFVASQGGLYLIRAGSFNNTAGGIGELAISGSSSGGGGNCNNPATGPDVIVGSIPNISNFNSVGGTGAYSLGTTSCNIGTTELNWFASINQHPVIGQNIYREENGRFEQIGMSWLKHGFTALQQNLCCTCNSSGTGTRLGVGCSDPYGSGLNGSQSGLGPRFQVNAFTGDYAYPYFQQGQTGDSVFKRIQVQNDDVSPTLHPGATYYGEAQYITPDDAASGNGFNNVSWTRLSRPGSTLGGTWRLSISGSTHREESALHAWAQGDPGVIIEDVNVAGEGQFVAACNVVDNLDGTWTYNYAIHNNNSDFSGQNFSVPFGQNVTVTGASMSFPLYHSGEPYSNVAWTPTIVGGTVTWETETYVMNQDANALRWGTTYSFWFTANSGPEIKSASLGLFKPGNPGAQTIGLEGPRDVSGGGGPVITNYCVSNPNSSGLKSKIRATNVDLVNRTMQLDGYDMTPNAFGYFLASLESGFVANPGGSLGNLCLGSNIGRGVGSGVLNSGPNGTITTIADLDNMPTPTGSTVVMSGDVWHFQAWHRDVNALGLATSNFTDGVRVSFP